MELAMTNRLKTPRHLAERTKQQKRAFRLRGLAEVYALRAKRQNSPLRRQHVAKASEHYRELAKLEEEVAAIRPKSPAPSV